MDLVDLLMEKRNEILATCSKHGAINVRVFGSCARDDYHDKSDVDFLIDFPAGLDFGKLCDL